jgi:hypothetical protein
MKKVIIPLAIAAGLILIIFIFPVINNISLNIFAQQLNSYPLPKNTELVERKKVCGKLNGCGNGMDFFACILIKSDLSLDKIKEYYNKMSARPAKLVISSQSHAVESDVIKADGFELHTDYNEHSIIIFDSLKNLKDFSDYYVVMIYDGGYSADFDLRGH